MNQEHILTPIKNPTLPTVPKSWRKTAQDIISGFSSWRIWLVIAWQDIRLRYRRSQLGPLWLTISMAIQIYSLGFLYGKLFHADLSDYYPYLAGGILTWSLLSSLINESTTGFINAEGYLRQMHIPYTIFVLRTIARNLIIFFHNIIVIVPIIIIFHLPVLQHLLLIIPGLFIIVFSAFGVGLLLSVLGTRYRDLSQVIQSLIQVAFFLSPIMWQPERLPPQYLFAVNYNPLAQYVDLIRYPLIGKTPNMFNYEFTCMIGLIALILALIIFNRGRKRIIYWL